MGPAPAGELPLVESVVDEVVTTNSPADRSILGGVVIWYDEQQKQRVILRGGIWMEPVHDSLPSVRYFEMNSSYDILDSFGPARLVAMHCLSVQPRE